jgi:hypothetical protein
MKRVGPNLFSLKLLSSTTNVCEEYSMFQVTGYKQIKESIFLFKKYQREEKINQKQDNLSRLVLKIRHTH